VIEYPSIFLRALSYVKLVGKSNPSPLKPTDKKRKEDDDGQ
jgi:hypothetical protein